ncbi:MAG: penicillin acylase family protein [Pseudomonadota bacterium]
MSAQKQICLVLGLGLALAFMSGCSSPDLEVDSQSVKLRMTKHGIPHIKADTYEGGGYGLGYSFARHNLCMFAKHMLILRGERAKYFGAEGTYSDPFVAPRVPVNNLQSDFYHTYYYSDALVEEVKAATVPEVRQLNSGFIKGFNAYLGEDGPEACRAEPWLKPLSEADIYRRQHQMVLLGSSNPVLVGIVAAQPPEKKAAQRKPYPPSEQQLAAFAEAKLTRGGSNAAAFGGEITEGGHGLIFGNPHFPWFGAERLYAFHLTVGDDLDVSGSGLYGGPVPSIGNNASMGWSLTFSTDQRATFYRMPINPDNPMEYLVDGKARALKKTEVTVQVKTASGALEPRRHTFYATHHGPVVSAFGMTWNTDALFTIRDANRLNHRFQNQLFAMAKANTVRDVKASLDRIVGLPFSNVLAADSTGETLFTNTSVRANVPDELYAGCVAGDLGRAMLARGGLYVLDGSRSACDWKDDADAPQAGIPAGSDSPTLFRRDYTLHANDSHWVVNGDPESFLSGFPRVMGDEKTPRGERTRILIKIIEDRVAGRDGFAGNKMSADLMHKIFYQSRSFTAESMIEDLIADCEANPQIMLEDKTIDATKACAVLKAWDTTASLDSKGGHIFRQFSGKLPRVFQVSYLPQATVWKTPFDVDDPVNTPAGLAITDDIRSAFAKGIKELDDAGIALDAKLGDIQFGVDAGGKRIAFAGGPYNFHKVYPRAPLKEGYTGVTGGDTHVFLTTLTPDGPKTKMVLAYSQSTDPTSDAYLDQLALYGSGAWIDLPFTDAEIQAAPGYTLTTLSLP